MVSAAGLEMPTLPLSEQTVRNLVAQVPRVPLALLPTPLQDFPGLAQDLGIGRLFVKRDDLTGLAFGGNKVRNLEFRMAEALALRANVVIAGLESQSNSARQVAASANLLGLKTILVLRQDRDWNWQGNLLIDRLLGADVRFVEGTTKDVMDAALVAAADEQRALGNRPYVMNHAPSFARGSALAYLLCALEIVAQAWEHQVEPTHVYMASGNKGHAGLILGTLLLNQAFRPIAISQRHGTDRVAGAITGAQDAAAALGLEVAIAERDVESYDDYVGEHYGAVTAAGLDAMKWAAQRAGLLLDPIYTAKAMAGIIDHARLGMLDQDSVVVFVHTGGLPALFAHKEEILARLG